jgi:hypothetical protein
MRFEDSLLIAEPKELDLLQMVLVMLGKSLFAIRLTTGGPFDPLDINYLLELQSYLPELQ